MHICSQKRQLRYHARTQPAPSTAAVIIVTNVVMSIWMMTGGVNGSSVYRQIAEPRLQPCSPRDLDPINSGLAPSVRSSGSVGGSGQDAVGLGQRKSPALRVVTTGKPAARPNWLSLKRPYSYVGLPTDRRAAALAVVIRPHPSLPQGGGRRGIRVPKLQRHLWLHPLRHLESQ